MNNSKLLKIFAQKGVDNIQKIVSLLNANDCVGSLYDFLTHPIVKKYNLINSDPFICYAYADRNKPYEHLSYLDDGITIAFDEERKSGEIIQVKKYDGKFHYVFFGRKITIKEVYFIVKGMADIATDLVIFLCACKGGWGKKIYTEEVLPTETEIAELMQFIRDMIEGYYIHIDKMFRDIDKDYRHKLLGALSRAKGIGAHNSNHNGIYGLVLYNRSVYVTAQLEYDLNIMGVDINADNFTSVPISQFSNQGIISTFGLLLNELILFILYRMWQDNDDYKPYLA